MRGGHTPQARRFEPDRCSLGVSKTKLTVSPLSSAFIVMMSSLPAHLSILAMLFRFMPAHSRCRPVPCRSTHSLRKIWAA